MKKIFIIFAIVILLVIVGIILYKYSNRQSIGIEGIPVIEDPIAKFKKYEGTQRGAIIKALIQDVYIYNQNEENINAERSIRVIYNDIDLATSLSSKKDIKPEEYYIVIITEYDENGYINEIKITQE